MEKTLPVYSTKICRNLLLGRFALPGSFLLLILLAALVTPVAAQQEVIIKGKVTELVDGTSLPGVNVLIKGTAAGTTTDVNGEYTLSVPTGATLIFSFVGYFPEEIVVSNQTQIDVPMSPDITTLQEMIVVGYGTVKREDLTGSVVSIKNDQLNPGANMSVAQALQGRAPGVQVYQKSGEPGSAMSVKIRGISSITAGNDPLYVIDGMPVNNISPVGSPSAAGISNNPNPRNPLNSLNPADIESIEILKDASATAIYGSRGTNGVVLITTKKGSAGALKINYNVQVGTQRVSNRLDLLSGTEYRDALNGIIDAGGGAGAARVDDNVLDTDWQKEVSRSAPIQSHDLSFSGGKDNTKFYASLGYFDQQGVLLNSGTKRYNARLNIENAIDKKYAFGMTMNASYLKDDYNSVGLGINENGSGMYSAVYYDPTVPVYDENGGYFRAPSIGTNMDNPVALMRGQYAKSNTYRVFGSVYGEYFVLPELSAKVKVAGDLNTSRRNGWIDPSTLIGLQSNGIASVWTGESNYYLLEGTLNYNKKIGDDHSVNAVAGATYEHFGTNTFNGTGRGYLTPDLSYNAIGTGASDLNLLGSGRQSAILASYLGRVNYSFKNRYLFTASFRADGSSRFGANNRFGYFPSAAVAWKIQEEPFLASVGFIDELKLRGSYGTVGNQAIGNYQFIRTYGASSGGPVFDNTRNTIFFPTRLANPDLQWESSQQADIGVDFQFFDHRITGSIEYYNRKTTKLLLPVPQPLSTGYGDRLENVGSIRNSGIELALAGDIFRGDNFTWNLGGNMATVKNEVLNLGPNKQILNGAIGSIPAGSVITRPGESLGSYYGYRVVGVWQTNDDYTGWPAAVKPGDLKFYDKDGSKSITAEDRVVLGSSIPDFTYGITSTWTYKAISLQAYFEGSQGGYLLNSTAADTYFPTAFRRNKLAEPYLNRWTPENPSNEYPSFVNPTSQGQQVVNSRTVENASYFRLQSVRLSYTLPLSKGPIKNVQFYAVGQNLFVITDYNGIDPTSNSLGDDVAKVDYNSYPMVRTFLLGANIQF